MLNNKNNEPANLKLPADDQDSQGEQASRPFKTTPPPLQSWPFAAITLA